MIFASLLFLLISVVKYFVLHCFLIFTLIFTLLSVDLTGVSSFINCDQFIKKDEKEDRRYLTQNKIVEEEM